MAVVPRSARLGGPLPHRLAARPREAGSHRTLPRDGWPDLVLAFHDSEEIGPRMLARTSRSGPASRLTTSEHGCERPLHLPERAASGCAPGDITVASTTLRPGLTLTAFDYDADEHGRPDDIFARGVVEPSPEYARCTGSKWALRIDAAGIRHTSHVAPSPRSSRPAS